MIAWVGASNEAATSASGVGSEVHLATEIRKGTVVPF